VPTSDHKTAIEVELERLESKLRMVQLALEILTGVCAALPDPPGLDATTGEGGADSEDHGRYLTP
jgi:hypothetical protein